MAIEQNKINGGTTEDIAKLMEYDMNRHIFIPTQELLKLGGVNFQVEAGSAENEKVEFYNLAETIYALLGYQADPRNLSLVKALLAENANEEQTTIARAFIYMAPFVLSGGDRISNELTLNVQAGSYIPPDVLLKSTVGINVKAILSRLSETVNYLRHNNLLT